MADVPTYQEEMDLHRQGYHLIAGVDEAGRGSLAGPVVAAAVVLPLGLHSPDHFSPSSSSRNTIEQNPLSGLRDSKQMTATARESVYAKIIDVAEGVGIGIVAHTTIDLFGIAAASRIAMRTAINKLPCHPEFLLVDGFRLPDVDIPQKHLIKGDGRSFSIAAASVVAKVTRDRLMIDLDRHFPVYGFAHNKGYGTSLHFQALERDGPCPLHRRSFSPLKDALAAMEPEWLSWN
ncbi:MAG: ribonuclease HII [Chloroflexi bacterium]|nr:ribonuclease HII [Chloroflexota bacterium]